LNFICSVGLFGAVDIKQFSLFQTNLFKASLLQVPMFVLAVKVFLLMSSFFSSHAY